MGVYLPIFRYLFPIIDFSRTSSYKLILIENKDKKSIRTQNKADTSLHLHIYLLEGDEVNMPFWSLNYIFSYI